MIRIVVDANILLSALLGGSARLVLFDNRFDFVTAEFTLEEVRRYVPEIAKRSSVPTEELHRALALIPLHVYGEEYYETKMPLARRLLERIDPYDADILALYLEEGTYLWSDDKDFERIDPPIRLLKTKDFF